MAKGGDKMKYKGRPAKYESPEEMQKIITRYFNDCYEEGLKPTVSGLAYVLGMERKTLITYENAIETGALKNFDDSVKIGFRNTIKDAKRFIESCLEEKLVNGNTTPIGTIFALKNNYGWVDKQEVEQTSRTITIDVEE